MIDKGLLQTGGGRLLLLSCHKTGRTLWVYERGREGRGTGEKKSDPKLGSPCGEVRNEIYKLVKIIPSILL